MKGSVFMDAKTRKKVKDRVAAKIDAILMRRIDELESDMRNLRERNPFGSRLVPSEIWKGSKFERSFVTSFGQGVYEQVAYEIALGSGAKAENQHSEMVTLNTWQDEAINNLLTEQRGSKKPPAPNWQKELDQINSLSNPRHVEVETRFDLYIKRQSGQEEYYSLKTVKANLDQTEIAKRDMLRISIAKPECKAFLALPYNPDGEGKKYKWAVTKKLFDMNTCPAVLIGSKFWNAVGDDPNTFKELLEIFDEIGADYYSKIKHDYLEK